MAAQRSHVNTAPVVTPSAQVEHAKKLIVEGVSQLVEAMLARGVAEIEWVDQKTSPLGRRRHLELVRSGKLPGRKDGKKVLVRREDINRYLDKEGFVAPKPKAVEEDNVEDMVSALLGGSK